MASRMVETESIQESWIDPRLDIQSSCIDGQGIFTREFINAGEIVMVWGGTIFNLEEIRASKAKPHSVSGYSEGLYLGQPLEEPDAPDLFLNHSCDPNLWMLDEVTLAARRDIAAGEELTADYAMWELDEGWNLNTACKCSSSLCRYIITGEDWRLVELQDSYKGHFLPCINERIKKLMQKML